jgi:regulator of protease activity HflC (stomatin/prohibitin superfamily)
MGSGLQMILLAIVTMLVFFMDGIYVLPFRGGGDLAGQVKTKQTLATFKILLAVVWIMFSGWYLSSLLGVIVSLLIFVLPILGASYVVRTMYEVPKLSDAFSYALKLIFAYPFPGVKVSEGKASQVSGGTVGLKIGGPGLLKVGPDSAVVLKKGKELKVVGVGTHFLKLGEKVGEAVDLRPQTKEGTVKAMTKDGFEVEIDFSVGFQIDTGGRTSTVAEPYPYSEPAVLKAVFLSKQVGADGAKNWHERIPGAVFGNVREMIATHRLEDLFEPDKPGADPRTGLKKELFNASKGAAAGVGAQLNWVSFTTPKIPDDATRQYVERWQARLQQEVSISEANVQATAEKLKGEATAESLRLVAKAMQDQGLDRDVIRDVLVQAARPGLETALQRVLGRSALIDETSSGKLKGESSSGSIS